MASNFWMNFTILVTLLVFTQHIAATWWFISQLPLHAVSSGIICDNIPGLIGKQRRMCRRNEDAMVSLGKGALQGVNECQFQFRKHRWNCSTIDRDASVFGKVLLKVGTREAAFVYSVSSAGVVYSITRACSLGELRACACDPRKRGRGWDRFGESFEWGGCSDDVNYGRMFARTFIDAKERKNMDARALMNLHNNRAGRQAVKRLRKLKCKCHGISGSCAMRTCWRTLREFRRVGNFLKQKYNGAVQVNMNQNAGRSQLIVADRNHKKPTKLDLVYFDESPDYCVKDLELGSLGTEGRECNNTSPDTDGCTIMCCGHGYHSEQVQQIDKCSLGTEGRECNNTSPDTDGCTIMCCGHGYHSEQVQQIDKCQCKFIWCCNVICKNCTRTVQRHTCKGPNSALDLPWSRGGGKKGGAFRGKHKWNML